MRKLLLLSVALLGISFASCEYDDTDLWGAVEDVADRVTVLENAVKNANKNIDALQALITALQNQVSVVSVKQTAEGYVIQFSDGTTATITNGVNANAPIVSVKQDTDGNYYWTIDGEWLIVDGERVRANGKDGQDGENGQDGQDGENGKDGQDGKDAIAPQVRVNPTTKEWEISIDGGKTWESTGVIAQGRDGYDGSNGDAYFRSVDTSNTEYVIFVLYDGTEIIVPRYDSSAPSFIVEGIEELNLFEHGQTISYLVTATNVANYSISKPDGWRVNYENDSLYITAPVAEHTCAEQNGVIAINLVSKNNKSIIVKIEVKVKEIELRILTFEDADAKFAPYELYGGASIKTWSDLIDDMQYGGSLTYTDYMTDIYWWHDAGNTELFHSFETPLWGGGHVVSNYVIEDYTTLPEGYYGWYELQMCVPIGGHNGSRNFGVHNGYVDFYNIQIYDAAMQGFEFADGVERVFDHMYVTNTNYVLNSLAYGDGFNQPANENTFVKIVAYGYNSNDELVGSLEFTLCDGKDNILKTWEKWDLSSLGKVAKLVFNFSASDDMSGTYGLNCPAYFAYDDVAVRF